MATPSSAITDVDNIFAEPAAGGAGGGSHVVEKPGAAGAGGDGGAVATEVETEPEWLAEAPEEYKGLSSQANVKAEYKKWLRDTFDELHTFRSTPYGTRESMQELMELFPGGIEDLRSAQQTLQETARVQRMLESGDPDQMNEAIEERLVSSPDLFIAETQGRLDALKRSNLTSEYDDIARVLTQDRLNAASDGGFEKFYDTLAGLREKYLSMDPNSDDAKRLAGQLAATALELGGWWGGAKGKLGFGQKTDGERQSVRSAAVTRQRPEAAGNEREMQAARRDVESFQGRYREAQMGAVRPIFMNALNKELTARKLDLPEKWKVRIGGEVGAELTRRLESDPTLQAIVNREHYKGNREDLRGYDTSDKVVRNLVAAVKTRAERLIPKLVSEALADIAALKPAAKAADPAAGVRGSGAPKGGSDKHSAAEVLKDRKVGVSETLDALFAN